MRKSNMEMLRIVAMIFIITHHLIINGIGWTGISNADLSDDRLLYVLGGCIESFVIIGVNLFFMLSGYFQIKFKWKKWVTLFLTVYLYMFLIQIIGVAVGYQTLNASVIKMVLLPFDSYWFLKVYMILMLLAPLLNLVINHMDAKTAKYFFMVFVTVFSAYTFLDNTEQLGVGRGYSLLSASCLYIVGALISKGLLFKKTELKSKTCFMIYLLAGIANTVLIQIAINILHYGKLASVLLVYNNPLIVIESISFFLIFTQLEINENGKAANAIRYFGKSTLAVYIIHSSNKVIPYYRNLPLEYLIYGNHIIAAYLLVVPYAIAIFVICTLIDKGFQRIFGKLIGIFSDKLSICLDRLQGLYVK